jgi:hypothetical protein
MARLAGMVGATGLVCLLLAGCSLTDFNLNASAFLASGDKDRVVAGSLETVAASTEESLQQLGLFVTRTREGESIRLTTTTKAGQRFSLVLTRQPSDRGELTRVRFEWDNTRDENMELQILSQVDVHPAR